MNYVTYLNLYHTYIYVIFICHYYYLHFAENTLTEYI